MESILIFVKNKVNSNLMRKSLEKLGYHVVENCGDNDSISNYDLIILDDWYLNNMLNLIKKIKTKSIFIPFILITSHINNLNEIKLTQIVDDIIKIPVSESILLSRIKNLLKLRRLSQESEERYLALAENSPVGVCIIRNKKLIYTNTHFREMVGINEKNIIGCSLMYLINTDDRAKFKIFLDNKSYGTIEFRFVTLQESIWVICNQSKIEYQGKPSILLIFTNITQRKKMEKRIKYLSFHDKVTGLYNRAYFEEELKRLNTERQLPVSILMADINGLKLTNDSFGHHEGDKLLKATAKVLKRSLRSEDIIARWGGDEFIALLPQTSTCEISKIIERIKYHCENVDTTVIPLNLALGESTKTEFAQNIDNKINEAEESMYKHKLQDSRSVHSRIFFMLMETLREKNIETQLHSLRMEKLSKKFGSVLDLKELEINKLSQLASLHDIGKITITEEILKKNGSLTKKEWEIIKKHPEAGYQIARASNDFSYISEGILSHHEWWDGTGYPQGLKGKEIPLISRIISIVDAYDVMTHHRVYRKAISKEKAIDELKNYSGIQFDPNLVEVFVNKVLEYY